MMVKTILHWHLINLDTALEDMALETMPPAARETFLRLRRLYGLHLDSLLEGDEDFSWRKCHERGWLCENDYTIFAEALKDISHDVPPGAPAVFPLVE